jgi:hypothetical protein
MGINPSYETCPDYCICSNEFHFNSSFPVMSIHTNLSQSFTFSGQNILQISSLACLRAAQLTSLILLDIITVIVLRAGTNYEVCHYEVISFFFSLPLSHFNIICNQYILTLSTLLTPKKAMFCMTGGIGEKVHKWVHFRMFYFLIIM